MALSRIPSVVLLSSSRYLLITSRIFSTAPTSSTLTSTQSIPEANPQVALQSNINPTVPKIKPTLSWRSRFSSFIFGVTVTSIAGLYLLHLDITNSHKKLENTLKILFNSSIEFQKKTDEEINSLKKQINNLEKKE